MPRLYWTRLQTGRRFLVQQEDAARAAAAAADALGADVDRRAADGSLLAALRADAAQARREASEERARGEAKLEAARKDAAATLDRYRARSAAALRRSGRPVH